MIAGRKSQPLILIDEFKRSNGAAVELPSKGFGNSNAARRPNTAFEAPKKDAEEKSGSAGINQKIQKTGKEVKKEVLEDEDEEEFDEDDVEDEDDDEDDDEESDEIIVEDVFEELSGGKAYVTLKDILKWDYIQFLSNVSTCCRSTCVLYELYITFCCFIYSMILLANLFYFI